MSEIYACAICHGEFTKGQSDQDAEAEARSLFPAKDLADGDGVGRDERARPAARRRPMTRRCWTCGRREPHGPEAEAYAARSHRVFGAFLAVAFLLGMLAGFLLLAVSAGIAVVL
jgi:hypothetical protein